MVESASVIAGWRVMRTIALALGRFPITRGIVMLSICTVGIAISLPCQDSSAAAGADPPQKFTTAPGEETEQIKELIAKADSALRSGKSSTDVLTDPVFLPAHEWPRFRRLIRSQARDSRAEIVCPDEPGTRLIVTGTVLDETGKPRLKAVVYMYQTSAKGWYSDRAAHVAANEGDRKHARLFGYLKTDDAGRFELRTIRPAGYPESDLPAHIHLEVERRDERQAAWVTELLFDNDPRLTPEKKARSEREGFIIGSVKTDSQKAQIVEIDLKMR
jgi:protocatechuate 3,4-dioxygenase beta subunit